MIEIIALIFLTRKVGRMAITKGLPPGKWKFYTILAWFAFETLGAILGFALFGLASLTGLMLFALMCAVGGGLYVHALLDKKPDDMENDINNLGS